MQSLLRQHPVGKGKAAGFKPAICQVLEELRNHSSAPICSASFVQHNIEEFSELNHAWFVLVHHLDQFFNLLEWADEAETDKRAADFFDSDGAGIIII